jgi:hypothetical protein
MDIYLFTSSLALNILQTSLFLLKLLEIFDGLNFSIKVGVDSLLSIDKSFKLLTNLSIFNGVPCTRAEPRDFDSFEFRYNKPFKTPALDIWFSSGASKLCLVLMFRKL